MEKKVATVLTLVAVLAAIGAPILLAIYEARNQALDDQTGQALLYAKDVLRRTDSTTDQIERAFDRLAPHTLPDPCSAAQLSLMREIDLASSYIQAVGRVSGTRMVCSSLGTLAGDLELGPIDLVTSKGVSVRSHVVVPFAPDTAFLVVERDGYAAIIHKELPIDATTPEVDASLATFTIDNDAVLASRGYIAPAWLQRPAHGSEETFVDAGYVVAVVRSARYRTGAVAALPIGHLAGRIRVFSLKLIPIGLVGSLVLAWSVLHLARLQLAMRAVIRSALRRREFYLVYQPIVDLRSRRCVGAEALIRWKRPGGEMVRPDLFIPVAEESGLIQQITARVIEIVGTDAATLFALHPQCHIAINVSPTDLHDRKTLELVRDLASRTGAGPGNFVIEATERGMIKADSARQVLRDMRAGGVRVAIDDFGTGYSSLSLLESFELDYLKIDKSFVNTIGTKAATSQVITHIIEMAKQLQLLMIAEGVETEEQARFLSERGVQFAQGWLFGKPMTLGEVVALIDKSDPTVA